MIESEKTTVIAATDRYGECFQDNILSKRRKNEKGPSGYVEIYEIDENSEKQLIGKNNLVVYLGREWLLSRAFNYQNVNITPDKDEYICWFGLGTGGCPVGDPLDPISPTNLDTDLDTPCGISQTDVNCAEFVVGWYYKHPLDSLTFVQDPDNDNKWLLMSVTTTISAADAVGFNLSEAGLFTAQSDAGGYAGPFSLFARITFPTIVKTSARQLVFVWYIYF